MTVFVDFLKDYWKRCKVIAIVLSAMSLLFFYGAIIPAAIVTETGEIGAAPKLVGGIDISRGAQNVAFDMTVPRNAAGEKLQFVGDFKVTHYCACTICTWGTGITATGKAVAEGMIASDWKVLPPHTVVYVKHGDSLKRYVVEDRGGAIDGNRLDIYLPTHGQALQAGVFSAEVYVDPGTELPGRN
jgi:3D (Asp-Asp-Asp) domain-containing protein